MADRLQNLAVVLGDKLFEVADYQRPFSWEEKQLRDLWDDLDLLGTDRHYAGTLVLKSVNRSVTTQEGEDLTSVEVVDGQQRLTTCLILIDRIRRAMIRFAGRHFPGIDGAVSDMSRLLTVNVGGVTRPRLTLGTELRTFFINCVLGDDVPPNPILIAAQERLWKAAELFDTWIKAIISDVSDQVAAQRLVDLRARVCFRLRFLVYDVESSAEVGVLFETLNSRGKVLSDLEKVKNYLLYLSRAITDDRGDQLVSEINRAWSTIFENLAVAQLDDDVLLRAHWLTTRNPDARRWARDASIKAEFPRSRYVPSSMRLAADSISDSDDKSAAWEMLFQQVSDYVSTLQSCSGFLRDMYAPSAAYHGFESTDAERAAKLTGALIRSGAHANFRPLLLAARLKYPRDGSLYCRLVELCEKYSARVYTMGSLRSTTGQTKLTRAAHDLYSGVDPAEVIEGITETLWQWAGDDVVRAAFAPKVNWYWKRHKYVLYEYELHLTRNPSDVRPFDDFQDTGARKTTEHVLPQNPGQDSQWRQDFTEEELSNLTGCIGNLVLTYDNSAYSNKDYADKRGRAGQESPRCYLSTSALAQERELASQFTVWTPAEIETRRQRIEEWALQRWAVAAPSQSLTPDADDDAAIDEELASHQGESP